MISCWFRSFRGKARSTVRKKGKRKKGERNCLEPTSWTGSRYRANLNKRRVITHIVELKFKIRWMRCYSYGQLPWLLPIKFSLPWALIIFPYASFSIVFLCPSFPVNRLSAWKFREDPRIPPGSIDTHVYFRTAFHKKLLFECLSVIKKFFKSTNQLLCFYKFCVGKN